VTTDYDVTSPYAYSLLQQTSGADSEHGDGDQWNDVQRAKWFSNVSNNLALRRGCYMTLTVQDSIRHSVNVNANKLF